MANSKKNSDLSLASRSLRYKLKVSFSLMSILPLLVCIYLVSNYILPQVGLQLDVGASILISIFIAAIGFWLIKEVFDRILSVTTEAKLIAAGDVSRRLDVKETDEVGDLGEALNQLTSRIRSNMDELKSYGEKTTEINLEIQKRVIVLSSLLQISSLISQSSKLDDILKLTIEKSRFIASSDIAFLLFREEAQENFCVRVADGINANYLLKVTVNPKGEIFEKAIFNNKPITLDKNNFFAEDLVESFYEKFRLKNTLVLPVYLRGRVVALLGIGNGKETFLYTKDDLDILDIFAKQVAIALENDILMHRVEKLEIKDTLTGLYNEAFIRSRLQEEIKRAIVYRRPCGFIVIDIDNFRRFAQRFGSLQTESALKKISSLVKDSVTEIDRVGRIGDDEIAIILPERNKRQAQQVAEEIRKKVEFCYSEEQEEERKLTISAGVSENPLDGVDANDLFTKAKAFLETAKKQGKNKVVSFMELGV